MSDFAAIIGPIVVSGSRKSDGTPNDSGTVWAYRIGTTTTVNLYADAAATVIVTQPITLDEGGRVNRSDYPDGVFTTQPIRLLVQDSDGGIVSDSEYVPGSAGATGLDNDGSSVSTLDEWVTKAFTSFGGQDFLYKESGGATSREINDKFREQGIWVTDFGAVGDGVAIDTTAIQAAFSRAKALSCPVIFPAGDFRTSQAITLSDATGVSIIGAGIGATTITCTHATANCFTLSTCASFAIRGLSITHATSSTGVAVALAACTTVSIDSCDLGGGTFDICVNASGAGQDLYIQRSSLFGLNASATGRGLKTTYVRTSVSNTFIRSTGGAGIEFTGAASDGQVYSCDFSVNGSNLVGILFNAATGSRFNIFSNPSLGAQATPIDVTAQAVWPTIIQSANNVRPVEQTVATGATITPVIKLGNEIRLSATSGGAGTVTVADPALLPTTVPGTDIYFDFIYKNSSGGAVTWDFTGSTVYKNAAAIPTTAAHTITVRYRWDPTSALLRECSRADTVT